MIQHRINIAEAKARLSYYLDRVSRGETVIICRRNVPIAELRRIPAPLRQPRPVGIDRGMTIPDSFFEPLPNDLLDAFEGRGDSGRDPCSIPAPAADLHLRTGAAV